MSSTHERGERPKADSLKPLRALVPFLRPYRGELTLLDGRGDNAGGGGGGYDDRDSYSGGGGQPAPASQDLDDEIPF